jgi:hypothetical protein
LDPNGDLARNLRETGKAKPFSGWPCYHTEFDVFDLAGQQVGIVGRVVGIVICGLGRRGIIREWLPVSREPHICRAAYCGRTPPYFVIIDRALRDDGTSYHLCAAG